MEINGYVGELRRRERKLFRCNPEVFLDQLPCVEVVDKVLEERQVAESMCAFDGVSAATKSLAILTAERRLGIAADVAGPVLVHQIEEFYGIPHTPAIRPDHL